MPTSCKNVYIHSCSPIELNHKALAGGMNLITVNTQYRYTKFYLTVDGVNGYLVYVPADDTVSFYSATNLYTYLIPLVFGPDFHVNIVAIITGASSSAMRAPLRNATFKPFELNEYEYLLIVNVIVSREDRRTWFLFTLLIPVWAIVNEILQGMGLSQGSYDPYDLVCYAVPLLADLIINWRRLP